MNLSQRLREGNRPQFLCSLFIPEPHREAVVALYNFKLEISRVQEEVSDPLIGQLRLKWWYDATERLGTGKVPNHPVVLAVDQVFSKYKLNPELLLSLVEGYADDLKPSPTDKLEMLFKHLDRTQGALNSLVISLVGGGASEDSLKAGYHIGRAWGLSQLLRNLPEAVSRGRIFIPDEIRLSKSVSTLDILKLSRAGALPDSMIRVIRTIVDIAEKELFQGRRLRDDIDLPIRATLLSGIVAEQNLAALKVFGFDPRYLRHRSLELGPINMVKLWWAARKGIY